MKMRVAFSQLGGLKYLGHLDLMRAMHRALRRSGLPLRYSQGYNPHILMSLAAPLSVGIAGQREVFDLPLEQEVAPGEFLERLNMALPPLLRALQARALADVHPAPMAQLYAAAYHIEPSEGFEQLSAALPGLLERAVIPAQRKGKRGIVDFDLKPLIHEVSLEGRGFKAVLALSQQGTCRPDLFMKALADEAGMTPPVCRIERLRLFAEGMIPLEDA